MTWWCPDCAGGVAWRGTLRTGTCRGADRYFGNRCQMAAIIKGSMSGNRRRARLERDVESAEMDELGVGGEVKEFSGLRQQQHWRRGEQRRASQRQNGADRAIIRGMLVRSVAGVSRKLD